MDKIIVDKLIQYGLITNIDVNPEHYKDVNELIEEGIITIPGAKPTIDELLKDINYETPNNNEEIIIDSLKDEEAPLDETPNNNEEIIIDSPKDEEAPLDEIPNNNEEIIVEDNIKKSKKQNKK